MHHGLRRELWRVVYYGFLVGVKLSESFDPLFFAAKLSRKYCSVVFLVISKMDFLEEWSLRCRSDAQFYSFEFPKPKPHYDFSFSLAPWQKTTTAGWTPSIATCESVGIVQP